MSTNNMKPFDPTKPCQTRDGRKVRILCTDANICSGETIIALVTNQDGTQAAETRWFPNGNYYYEDSFRPDRIDLINTPPKPKYRPWTPAEAAQHVGEKVKSKSGEILSAEINRVDSGGVVLVGGHTRDVGYLFEFFTFLDGTPCGVKIVKDAQ